MSGAEGWKDEDILCEGVDIEWEGCEEWDEVGGVCRVEGTGGVADCGVLGAGWE